MIRLITMLAGFFPALVSAILGFVARKAATSGGVIASFAVITVAFVASVNTIIGTISSALIAPSFIGNAVGMFIPSNFGLCTSAVVAAYIARAAYDLARDKLKIINSAN